MVVDSESLFGNAREVCIMPPLHEFTIPWHATRIVQLSSCYWKTFRWQLMDVELARFRDVDCFERVSVLLRALPTLP